MKTMFILAAGVLALAACDRDRPGQTTTTGARTESAAERAEDKVEHKTERAADKAENTGDRIEGKTEHTGDKVENKTESAGTKIEGAAKDVKQEAKEQWNKVDRKVTDEPDHRAHDRKTAPATR